MEFGIMMDFNHRDPEPTPRASASPSVASDPRAGLWLGCRFTHELGPLPGQSPGRGRLVEVDVIVASASLWADSAERRSPNWAVHEDGGLVIAERIVG